MIDGIKVNLRGLELTVPPMNGAVLEDFEQDLNRLLHPKPEDTLAAQLASLRAVTLATCKVNHPDLTAEALRDAVDLGNRGPLVKALLGVAGFEALQAGEAQRP